MSRVGLRDDRRRAGIGTTAQGIGRRLLFGRFTRDQHELQVIEGTFVREGADAAP